METKRIATRRAYEGRLLKVDVETVVTPSGQTVEVAEGTAVLDAALENNIKIDHNCGGNCACSTCHIILDSGFKGHEQMTEDEEDMLDEADGVTETSRLACQWRAEKEAHDRQLLEPALRLSHVHTAAATMVSRWAVGCL